MRSSRAFLILGLCLALTACVAGGGRAPEPAANPITGGTIATTSLEAPVVPAAAPAQPGPTPAPPPGPPPPGPPTPAQPTPAQPTPVESAPGGTLAVKTPPPAKVDPADLSPEALACTRKGGTWARAGKAAGKTCLYPTGDAGASCRRQSDCEGLCLARSRSCAPIKPMFGCNAILQDDGREVTLCID